MVSDLALDLAFQCQGWMKSRFRTLSVDNFTLKSWNNLWNENSKFWKNRRRQLLHVEQTACLFSILCAFKSAFRTNCAWHSSLEIWVLDFVKIACTLICECLKISLIICVYCFERKHGVEHKQNLCFLVMFFSRGERHNPRYFCNVWNEWECIVFIFEEKRWRRSWALNARRLQMFQLWGVAQKRKMQPETTLIEFVGWVALHLQLFFFQIVVYLQHLFYKLCRNMSLNFTAMDSRQALCDFSSFKVQMCPHLFCFSKIQQLSQQKQNL